jgi:hypothetical protein
MLLLRHLKALALPTAGAFFALAVASSSARADEMVTHLGPVKAHEPILTAIGGKRVVAFYVPHNDICAVQAVVWDEGDIAARSVSRLRIGLSKGQIAHIDSAENNSLDLQCGGQSLAIVDASELGPFRLLL